MKKFVVLGASILVLALAGYSYGVPVGQPFQELLGLINGLAVRVTALEAGGGGDVTRTVIADTIDLNGQGDVILEATGLDNIKRVRHFAKFPIAGLTTADPPTISLFHRPRTDGSPPFATGFIASNLQGIPPNLLGGFSAFLDPTAIVVEEGQVLLQFRAEIFNPSTLLTPNTVRYGLDGPGGTGDFRLVLIR